MAKNIINYSLVGLILLLPLFFLTLMTDFFGLPKNFLLIFGAVTLFCLFLAEKILSADFEFEISPFDLPVLAFGTAFLLSTLIAAPNKVESLLLPGKTGTILALVLVYFLIRSRGSNHTRSGPFDFAHGKLDSPAVKKLLNALLASAAILGLLSIYQFFGVGEAIADLELMKQKSFTPAGSLLTLATFLGPILLLSLLITSKVFKVKEALAKGELDTQTLKPVNFGYLIATILIGLGLGIAGYQLFTAEKPVLLPQGVGWSIAIEAFKNAPFFGVGPGNFTSAFTRYKPLVFNQTDLWNNRFGSSSNYYFELLTETGIVGLAAYLFLIYKVIVLWSYASVSNHQANRLNQALFTPLFLIFGLQLFLPSNLLLLLALFVFLAMTSFPLEKKPQAEKERLELYLEEIQAKFPNLKPLVLIPLVLLTTFLFFFTQVVRAEILYKQALDKAVQARGGEAYNLLRLSIKKNPYLSNYRLSSSQLNLALANALAGKGELSDQDRANITQLVSQAIQEAKAVLALNPSSSSVWENLARIYRSLINVAQGANTWSVSAYNQAIFLDPYNPLLRIDLGGIFFALGNFDQAIRLFEQAVALKPDWANSHYNLAAALRESGKYQEAFQEMQTTLSLVEPNTNDFNKASSELEELRKKLAAEVPTASPSGELETLFPPEEAPEGIKPPLELEEEAAPAVPAGRQEITPSPTLTITPTPIVRISPTVTPTAPTP